MSTNRARWMGSSGGSCRTRGLRPTTRRGAVGRIQPLPTYRRGVQVLYRRVRERLEIRRLRASSNAGVHAAPLTAGPGEAVRPRRRQTWMTSAAWCRWSRAPWRVMAAGSWRGSRRRGPASIAVMQCPGSPCHAAPCSTAAWELVRAAVVALDELNAVQKCGRADPAGPDGDAVGPLPQGAHAGRPGGRSAHVSQ